MKAITGMILAALLFCGWATQVYDELSGGANALLEAYQQRSRDNLVASICLNARVVDETSLNCLLI